MVSAHEKHRNRSQEREGRPEHPQDLRAAATPHGEHQQDRGAVRVVCLRQPEHTACAMCPLTEG